MPGLDLSLATFRRAGVGAPVGAGATAPDPYLAPHNLRNLPLGVTAAVRTRPL